MVWPFIDYWSSLLFFNTSFVPQLHNLHNDCNYSSYIDQYFTFPPPKESFPVLPDPYSTGDSMCDILNLACMGALQTNPCFDINHITQTCPFLFDPLGTANLGQGRTRRLLQ
jgi:carboxypeptidase D